MLGRARLFVQASRFEDHGIAPLEALSAGAKLGSSHARPVSGAADGGELAPELVPTDLAAALRAGAALDDPPNTRARADALLAPHRPEALQRTVEERAAGLGQRPLPRVGRRLLGVVRATRPSAAVSPCPSSPGEDHPTR